LTDGKEGMRRGEAEGMWGVHVMDLSAAASGLGRRGRGVLTHDWLELV
jgi:hypothetical protein